jgi:hypothetical protein
VPVAARARHRRADEAVIASVLRSR